MTDEIDETTEMAEATDAEVVAPQPWKPDEWNWSSGDEPPVEYVATDDRMPTDPSPNYPGFPGHWEWIEQTDGEGIVVKRWPGWFFDSVPSEAAIRSQLAQEMQIASQAAQAALTATLVPLRTAVAKLNPADIRRPAAGFDLFGRTVIGEAEINRTNVGLGNLAEALQAVTAAVEATATANEQSVIASGAVLDALPTPALMAATPEPTTE